MPARPSIAFVDIVHDSLLDIFREEAPEGFELHFLTRDDPHAKIELLQDADYALVWAGRIPEDAVLQSQRLRLIQMCGQGLDHIPVAAARSRGISVANAGGTNSTAVAEMALLLMLATYRRLTQIHNGVRNGRWYKYELRRHFWEIEGKTVGIIGLGTIGKKVAQRLTGFECQRQYFDLVRPDPAIEQALGITHRPLDAVLSTSDIITLHVPLTASTRRLIDAEALAKMKPTAVLVNTARGPVVDEQALYEALVANRLAGAGLDVFEEEPPQDKPLLHLDQVVVSPHIAGGTIEAARRTIRAAFDNVLRVHAGQRPLNEA